MSISPFRNREQNSLDALGCPPSDEVYSCPLKRQSSCNAIRPSASLSPSSLSSHYLYRQTGMKILVFPESTAALLPSLQLLTPPFPLHHVKASQLPFSAVLPLCCSFTSTSLIVPPALSCHILPCSCDLTIERKTEGIQWREERNGK